MNKCRDIAVTVSALGMAVRLVHIAPSAPAVAMRIVLAGALVTSSAPVAKAARVCGVCAKAAVGVLAIRFAPKCID